MSTETALTDLSAAVLARGGELRAGGTDTTARQRSGVSPGPFTDLGGAGHLRGCTPLPGGGLRIGALTTLAELATDPQVHAGWPALALAAGTAATPQIRAAGTVGGNLLQRNRCWYYRNPHFSCLQKGGTGCPARQGDHHFGVVSGDGPCVAPTRPPSRWPCSSTTPRPMSTATPRAPSPTCTGTATGSPTPTTCSRRTASSPRSSCPHPCPANEPPATGPSAGPMPNGPWSRPPPEWCSTVPPSRTPPSRRAGWPAYRCA